MTHMKCVLHYGLGIRASRVYGFLMDVNLIPSDSSTVLVVRFAKFSCLGRCHTY